MYKIAIFDLDGTLLNTIQDLADSCNAICKKFGFPLHTVDEYKFFVGNGIPKLVQRAVPADTDEETLKAFLQEFIVYYEKHSADKTAPYDGIVETLKILRQAGVKIAVNTNKLQKASDDLCTLYFPGLIDYVCGNKTDFPVKPAPDGVYEIFSKLGMNEGEARKGGAIYIGDSDVDIQTGKNAGITAVGVDWGFRGEAFLKEKGANLVVKTAPELIDIILN